MTAATKGFGGAAASRVREYDDLTFEPIVRDRYIVAASAAYTRPANVTAYAAGDAVSDNATAGSVTAMAFALSEINDEPISIERLRLTTADTGPATASATFEVWLFSSDPTASSGVGGGDNAAFAQKRAGFIGRMSGVFFAASEGSLAECLPNVGGRIVTLPATGAKTIYALMKTLTAFTPSANSTSFVATIEGVQGHA